VPCATNVATARLILEALKTQIDAA
jgi:hypothetical protein